MLEEQERRKKTKNRRKSLSIQRKTRQEKKKRYVIWYNDLHYILETSSSSEKLRVFSVLLHLTMTNITTTTPIKLFINTPKYYNKFGHIQNLLVQITFPYIFIVAFVGFITNTATIVLLTKSFVTKNTRHKWTLIALGMSNIRSLM